jgi:beta-galactosidase
VGGASVGGESRSQVAIVFDWESWWASQQEPRITEELRYPEEIQRYYQAFWRRNVAVDFAAPGAALERYRLVVAPALRIVTAETAIAFERFVRDGGTLLMTFGSGLTDGNDRAHVGGYPGPLRRLFGLWVEEFDPLCGNGSEEADGDSGRFRCARWCDAIHLDGARATATYLTGFCAGRVAIAEHEFGRGRAVYVGTAPEEGALDRLLAHECERLSIVPPLQSPPNVEVTQRWVDGHPQTWVLNHGDGAAEIDLPEPVMDVLSGRELQGRVSLSRNEVMLLVPPAETG